MFYLIYQKMAGLQTVVNNYYSELVRRKELKIDFLTLLPSDEAMLKEYSDLGSNIYYIKGEKERNLHLFIKEIKNFFKKHHDYDIIHSHQTNFDFFYLKEAKKYNIPIRIMHSHNTTYDINKYRMFITRKLSTYYSNCHFACSEEAGRFYFGKKFGRDKNDYIVNNAVNLNIFKFDENMRQYVRERLNLKNMFVIGNVARMTAVKNHKFLIDVFYEVLKINNNSFLFLVGDGPTKEELMDYAQKKGIYDKINFYGTTNKVNEIMQCFDCLVLPSLFEGVPLTLIEAEASGIKCIFNKNIDSHLKDSPLELKLGLDIGAHEFANRIINFCKDSKREDIRKIIENSNFDISVEANKLYYEYIKLMKGSK